MYPVSCCYSPSPPGILEPAILSPRSGHLVLFDLPIWQCALPYLYRLALEFDLKQLEGHASALLARFPREGHRLAQPSEPRLEILQSLLREIEVCIGREEGSIDLAAPKSFQNLARLIHRSLAVFFWQQHCRNPLADRPQRVAFAIGEGHNGYVGLGVNNALRNESRCATPVSQIQGDPNAVPVLIRRLRRDSWFGASIYRRQVWPKLPASTRRHLPSPKDNVPDRLQAAMILGLGGHGKQAVPALVRSLKEDNNPDIRTAVVFSLGRLAATGDRTASAALTTALNDRDGRVRELATNALLKIDPEAAAKAHSRQPY